MAADFYTEWLQVPPGQRPPDHYALLGLQLFCEDKAAVEQAARKRLERLDRYGIHPDPVKRDACHRLMNEVARARVVLVTPGRKRPYDEELAKRRGVAPPKSAAHSTSPEEIAGVAQGTEAEAEAYLMDLAQAAQRAISLPRATGRPTRKKNPPRIYVGLICAAAIVCIGAWAWLHTSRRSPKPAVALGKTDAAKPGTVFPGQGPLKTSYSGAEPDARTKPPPDLFSQPPRSKLFVPPDASPVERPKAAPFVPPAAPPPPPRVVAPRPAGPMDATNVSLNRLTDWAVEKGIWSFAEPGRLRGEGPSDIDFDSDLPPDATISFRLSVLKGMRPRIHFDGPDIYVGNEGYSKKLAVHGKVRDLAGEPLDYVNGQVVAVKVIFRGADQFEVHLDDHVLTGRCQPHDKIRLRFSGGDWWSKGTTDYWDLHVSTSSAK